MWSGWQDTTRNRRRRLALSFVCRSLQVVQVARAGQEVGGRPFGVDSGLQTPDQDQHYIKKISLLLSLLLLPDFLRNRMHQSTRLILCRNAFHSYKLNHRIVTVNEQRWGNIRAEFTHANVHTHNATKQAQHTSKNHDYYFYYEYSSYY